MLRFIIGFFEVVGMAFLCAFDKQFMEEARAEQAQERWEKENKVLAYAEHS
jgi:hypothetical protein